MKTSSEIGNYNGTASLCAQSGEKFLKAIIESCFADENGDETIHLLRTHNFRTLYNKIVSRYTLSVNSRDCKWLGDFYFDARYPGDNFVVVTKEDAVECFVILDKIKEDTEKILAQENSERKKAKAVLEDLKCF